MFSCELYRPKQLILRDFFTKIPPNFACFSRVGSSFAIPAQAGAVRRQADRHRRARVDYAACLPGYKGKMRQDPAIVAEKLHRIVVVGGGAAGLGLVTRLGERVGRRGGAARVVG